MKVDVTPIQNFDKRKDGLFKIDLNNLSLPSEFIQHQTLVFIPPTRHGGNHKHPRQEIFISLSDDAELHWVDEDGITHIHKMKDGNQLYLFHVHSFVPHAVVNVSQHSDVILLEFSNECQYDVEPCNVL